jgi:beta-glucosidase
MTETVFPADFVWGAATASFQIEGATTEDGRSESIWDRFCATPGKVLNGDTGEPACDHYHRYKDDIALMKSLNLNAYRFSIAWPRVLPQGTGQVNAVGLDFYDRLVDELLAAGITPFVTLYHWDLPQVLEARGGWTSRATTEAFAQFADVVSQRIGDRVRHWITHNEPWCVSMLGYGTGHHAPGKAERAQALAAAHHVLLSHGMAVPILRANSPGSEVGITLNLTPTTPASDSEQDIAAARRFDGWFNRWYLDPLVRGAYPADMLAYYGADVPPVPQGDMATIATPIDFLGLNFYWGQLVADDPSNSLHGAQGVPRPDAERTEMGWEVTPDELRALLLRLHEEYGVEKLYITENGAAYPDSPPVDGVLDDEARRSYLERHLRACRQALDAGAPLAGYFAWSLLDNFEWAFGYSKRFGIVYVDYDTQERTVKQSGRWYADVARRNGFE